MNIVFPAMKLHGGKCIETIGAYEALVIVRVPFEGFYSKYVLLSLERAFIDY